MSGARASDRVGRRIERLTTVDRMYLHDERPAWPCHFGGLAIVEGRALLDDSGRLRMAEIIDRLGRRLPRVPDLRQRIHDPGWWRGGPLWVDDDRFSIARHVHEAAVDPPGDDARLCEAAARLYQGLLDRTGPLWDLWFLTGLSDGRVGILLKLHHAMADGPAAVAIMAALFDPDPDAEDPVATGWTPEPMPGGWSLLIDAAARTVRAVGHGVAMLARPMRIVGGLRIFLIVIRRSLGEKGAPRTSLNGIVRAGRRVQFTRLDLAAMKEVAHAQGGTVNDVVLALWAGGLRRLLLSRGEPVDGVEPVIGLAVSTRESSEAATIDNQVGSMVLRLPAWEPDPRRRLERIVELTGEAKRRRRLPAAIMDSMAWLSATPLGRYFNLHQRAVNALVTNVVGPAVPMYAFGARILDVVPIIQLVGNIGLTLCAFSYAGRVSLVVTADAHGFPDVDVLMAAMERDWGSLVSRPALEPSAAVAPSAPREPPLVAPRRRGRGAAPCR